MSSTGIAFDAQPVVERQKTGIGYYAANIMEEVLRLQSGFDFLFNYFTPGDSQQKKESLEAYRLQGGILNPCHTWNYRLYRLMWNWIPVSYSSLFQKKSALTHFFNYYTPPGVRGKTIATVYDMTYRAFPDTVRFKTKTMLDLSLKRSVVRSDKIMTISEFSKQEIIKYLNVPPEKIFVAYCGVDTQRFFPIQDLKILESVKQKYHMPETYFLYLGTLEPRKNIERLIQAYALLKKERAECWDLVLAGRKGWGYRGIFQQVQERNLEKYVHFTGYIEEADVAALYRGASAFVFPSLYEGFGMPPLEAMACGVPVLTAKSSVFPEIVGDAALQADPYAVEEIKTQMQQMMTDQRLREELSLKGLQRVKRFSWTQSARNILQVYQELLGGA